MSNLFGFYGFKKLKKKKVYYIRVRALAGKTKGKWSKVGKVKIRYERISYLVTNHFTG